MVAPPEVLLDALVFPEGPRWHNDVLWFSDIQAGSVLTVDLAGRPTKVADVPGRPSGLGFLPDGTPLVVSMGERRLLRIENGDLHEVANIAEMTRAEINDMVVDGRGNAYIGDMAYRMMGGEEARPGQVILVTPDGQARPVADDMLVPNGSVVTPDGGTLIVAETVGARLTAFTTEPDGNLSGRRTFAALEGKSPDGICLDAEGLMWVASPFTREFLRVREGGDIVDRIDTGRKWAIACALGGPDRRTLFLLTSTMDRETRVSSGFIETTQVDVPGAGWP